MSSGTSYRGFDPRTRRRRWLLFGAVITAIVLFTASDALGTLERVAGGDRQALPWVASRLFAWLAYLALASSVIYGLLLSTGILDAVAQRTVSFTLHQDLSAFGLALGTWHAMLLAIDRSVPYTLVEILVPFAGPYRPLWVGLGQVGIYLVLVLIASFYGRRRMGQKAWRRLHHASFVAFVALTGHGIMAGTDTGTAWASTIYLLAVTTVAFLLSYRIIDSLVTHLRGAGPKAARDRVATPRPPRRDVRIGGSLEEA
jgi:predicted ferric reductase